MYGGLTGKARQHQQIVRQGFLWCMAAIYLFAFTSLYVQIPGLCGRDGLLPASYILHDLSHCADKSSVCSLWSSYGECSKNKEWMIENCMKTCNSCHVLDTSFVALFKNTPTLLWVTPYLGLDTTTGMEFLCILGIILSFVLLISQRCRDCLGYLMLWFLYYSMLPAGQIFVRYQWDALLWESGFLAFLVAPWNIVLLPWRWIFFKCRRCRNVSRHHDSITFWLVKWLLFRLMFASGVVKFRYMDPSWWDLSALNWHYESQCIPTPIAWYFQKLPTWFHRLSVVLTYVIEIGIPFLAFAPVRVLRISAYCSEVFLQLLILLTGNYNFFNLLTIVLCMSLLDDKCILSRIQCFLCGKCACSSCLRKDKQAKPRQTDAKNDGYTELKQEDSAGDYMKNETEVDHHAKDAQDVEAGTSTVSSTEQTAGSSTEQTAVSSTEQTAGSSTEQTAGSSTGQTAGSSTEQTAGVTAGSNEASAAVNVHESDGSTTSQLVEQVLDWINTWHENRKFTQAKEFLHSKSFSRIKMAAICFSSLTVLIIIVVCTVKWFDFRITRKEPIRSEIAFSPEQLVMAVQRATQYAIWIGFMSLAIEILGAITRCLLEYCDRRSKVWQLFQCVAFSLVALWMFAVSLYSFSAVDRVVQRSLPKVVVDWYRATEYLELTNAYGLFRSMTGVGGRPEVIIIGSNSLKGPWQEYNFLYKPGNIYQPPPFIAPHQPRLDWQMWFAALESYSENPWFLSLVHKLLLGKKDVMQLMGRGPFDKSPAQFIRAQLYLYHYTQNTSSLSDLLLHHDRGEKAWWTREFVRDYLPFTASNSSLSDLEEILQKSGVYRPSFKAEVTWGILHTLIRDLRRVHRQMAPTTLINAILFMVVTCLVLKVWWRRTGRKFCTPSLIRVRDKTENLLKTSSKKLDSNMEKAVNKPSAACVGNCACCVKCADKFCEAYKHLRKKLASCWEMTQSKFTERIRRCNAAWKNRMPSVKFEATVEEFGANVIHVDF